jgi:hypothetical protein
MLPLGVGSFCLLLTVLAWPVQTDIQRIYSVASQRLPSVAVRCLKQPAAAKQISNVRAIHCRC